MKIGVVVFDGFTDLDFYLPWDLLNRVRLLGLHADWSVDILCNDAKIKSAAGLELLTTKPYKFARECDGLFFCSGPKTRELIRDKTFLSQFEIDDSRQVIAAIDSGALLLAAFGLLKNKRATTYPTVFDLLATLGAVPVRESFVAEGNIATGARCLTGDRLALWMIEKLTSKEASQTVFDSVKPFTE